MKDLIILGASGDLAKKKLFPAIYQNFNNGFDCRYIGYGRKDISNEEFRATVKDSVMEQNDSFLDKFSYIQGEYNKEGFKNLKSIKLNKERIFYLALPIKEDLLREIILGLKSNNLITENTVIVLEKPFGEDFKSAQELITILKNNLNENQVFLVDHYLAKDLIRNLTSLRFENSIFSNIWFNKYIEKIEIVAKEKEGIGERGEYYDKSGAIKDMVQNHILQILALTTMNPPKDFVCTYLDTEKIEILKNLRIFNNDYEKNVEIGQYNGYLNENYITKSSLTETYTRLVLEVNTEEWKGVPIFITTGKMLDEKKTEILIYFKERNLCRNSTKITGGNILSINIFPNNNIKLKMNSDLSSNVELKFTLSKNQRTKLPYANALMDIYNNDKSYTPSFEETLLSWKFIDKLEEWLEGRRKEKLFKY